MHSEDIPIAVFSTLPELPLSDVEENQNLQSSTAESSGSEYEEGTSTAQQNVAEASAWCSLCLTCKELFG